MITSKLGGTDRHVKKLHRVRFAHMLVSPCMRSKIRKEFDSRPWCLLLHLLLPICCPSSGLLEPQSARSPRHLEHSTINSICHIETPSSHHVWSLKETLTPIVTHIECGLWPHGATRELLITGPFDYYYYCESEKCRERSLWCIDFNSQCPQDVSNDRTFIEISKIIGYRVNVTSYWQNSNDIFPDLRWIKIWLHCRW